MICTYAGVHDVLDNYTTSIYELDAEKLLSSYAEDVHIYDCWGNWEGKGLTAWRSNVEEWFKGLHEDDALLQVDMQDVVIEEGQDVAFSHCAVSFTGIKRDSGEHMHQMVNRFTFGLKKVNNSWLITHEHSSLPIDLGTGKGMFDLR